MKIHPLQHTHRLLVVIGLCLASYVQAQSLSSALKYLEAETFHPMEIILPYRADSSRIAQIRHNMNRLEAGMTVDEVRKHLGHPDLIDPVFGEGERTSVLQSFQYTYLFERLASDEWGKAYEDKSLALSFNLNGQLISAKSLFVPAFREIIREQGLGFQFEIGRAETVKIDGLFLRLESVETQKIAGSPEAPDYPPGEGAKATFTAEMEDRNAELELSILSKPYRSENVRHFGKYKVSLLAVPDSERVFVIVE